MTRNSILITLAASLLVIMLLALAACSSGKPNVTNSPTTAAEVTTVKQPSVSLNPVSWQSDGIISENEYTRYQKIGEIDVFSRLEGDSVMFALKANTAGWLSLGIDPENKMQGADILMCYVKDAKG
jgi:hypothetical protein